jgi:alpha-beta hydrolase superfamily lysophospholipase
MPVFEWFAQKDIQKDIKKPKGVALILHGLNLKPCRMHAVVEGLNEAAIAGLNVSLAGHGENYLPQPSIDPDAARLESFRQVSLGRWLAEVDAAYRIVQEYSRRQGVPLFLVGYSLGALLGCTLMAAYPHVHFERMALLAPALAIHPSRYFLKPLARFPRLVIPSLTPRAYRANRGTPMAAYCAVYGALAYFPRATGSRLNVPTLILMDEADEFVSYSGVRQIIARADLSQWKLSPVVKQPALRRAVYHHLIIDALAVSAEAWEAMMGRMIAHLLA